RPRRRRPRTEPASGGPPVRIAGGDLAHLDGRPLGGRTLARDRDRLVLRAAVQLEEAADHLPGLRERTFDDHPSAAADLDAHALGGGPQRLAGRTQAAGLQLLAEAHHLLVSRTGLGVRPAVARSMLADQQQVRHDGLLIRPSRVTYSRSDTVRIDRP